MIEYEYWMNNHNIIL